MSLGVGFETPDRIRGVYGDHVIRYINGVSYFHNFTTVVTAIF